MRDVKKVTPKENPEVTWFELRPNDVPGVEMV